MKISAVIITLNEEQHIGNCIQSLLPIADEIVVVDSYSTDKTAGVCQKYGVRFVKHAYKGQIEQKQYGLALCIHQWIIALDGDEQLDPTLAMEIQQIKNTTPTADGYLFCRQPFYCGHWISHGGWHPEWKLRFWDKTKADWAGTNPHDRVIPKSGALIKKLPGKLLHFTFENRAEHLAQELKYARIDSKQHAYIPWLIAVVRGIASAIFKWIKDYLLKMGVLDGRLGFQIAWINSYGKFKKYVLRSRNA